MVKSICNNPGKAGEWKTVLSVKFYVLSVKRGNTRKSEQAQGVEHCTVEEPGVNDV